MIIQCDKCESKFKIDDSKVTEKGVKVKCKKCSNIFTVYPPQQEKIETLFEEPPKKTEEQKKEEVSFDLPSFEISIEEKKPTQTEAEPVKTESQEFSWDQFAFDIEEKKEEPKKEEPKEAPSEEFSFDFQSFGTVAEEPKKEEAKLDTEFDFEKISFSDKEEAEKPESGKSLEEFIKEEPKEEETKIEFEFDLGEKKEEEKPEASQQAKEEPFSFDSFKTEEKEPEKFSFEELKFEEPAEQVAAEEPRSEKIEFEFQTTDLTSFEKKEEEKPLFEEQQLESPSFTFLEEEKKISFPQEEFKKEEEPAPASFVAEEVKPRSGIFVLLISLLIVLLFSGTGIGFIWWQKTKIMETQGSLGVSAVKGEFLESKTLGNVFVVKGKVINGYRVQKSFLKIKCVLYSKDNKKLAEKIVFASNVFTNDEIKELTYPEIEKGLNNKMGKSMMNVNVSPGANIPFMIVFDKIPEGVSHFEVEALM